MMEQIGVHPYKWFFFLMLITACSSSKLVNAELPPITIHSIGDSTMAHKPNSAENPERGWVQMLTPFFNAQATLFNHAVNGRSTKSFRELGHWQPVFESLKPGDYLIIQFGHNDAKETDPVRYTNPQTSYRHNLTRYVEEARSKGAIPILCSSIARRKFNEQGVLLDAHGNYTLVVRMVALEMQVPFIDLQYHTEQLELAYGVEASKKLHLHYAAGEHPYFPEGITDNTHLSELGATEIARLFVEELVHSNHVLSKYVVR